MKRFLSVRLLFAIKMAIALILLAVLILTVRPEQIRSAFSHPRHPALIGLACGLVVPNIFLQWYRWHILLDRYYRKIPILDSIASLFGGMVIGFITPGRVGELGRFLFIRNVDPVKTAGLAFIDKWYAFITVVVGGVWGMAAFLSRNGRFSPYLLLPLLALAALVTAVALILSLFPGTLKSILLGISPILPFKETWKKAVSTLGSFPRSMAPAYLGLSFLLYAVYIVQYCFFAMALQSISWAVALTATTSVIFAKTLVPVSLADLGVREGASIYFFMAYGVDKAVAFNSSILLFSVNVLAPTVIGLFFLPRLGSMRRKPSE